MEKTKPKKLHLTVKILIGLIAGIIVGVILNLTNQAEIDPVSQPDQNGDRPAGVCVPGNGRLWIRRH